MLSRGLLSGHWSREREIGPGDFRTSAPRFRGENLDRNLALVEALRGVAEPRGATALDLSPDDLATIERAVPPGAAAGDRYDEHQMAALDSERPAAA